MVKLERLSLIRTTALAIFATVWGLNQSVSAATVAADTLPQGVTAVAQVEGISEYTLDNGLRVLLFPDRSKQTVTVNITYLVGSKHESYGETGMAHLLEHLLFRGTPSHPEIDQEMSRRGARSNGTTWLDRTNYYETLTASAENLEWALDLEADRMVNSFISKEDLDSEMTVVRNEFELGENSPQSVLHERIVSAAYLWHNYGNSTIGARADIENVPIEKLQAFYRTWYQPDNAILVVAGGFDESTALGVIADKFGAIPRPERPLPVTYTVEPAQDGERSVTLRRVGDVQVAGVAYHIPAGSHPDYPALEVLSFILGDSPSGRLYKTLVEPGEAASVYSFNYPLAEPGLLLAFAEVRQGGSAEKVRDVMVHELEENLAEQPLTDAEVSRGRDRMLKDWETTMRDSQRAAISLTEWAAMGDWRLVFLHRDALEKVTADDVKRVAGAYLRRSNRTTGVYLPTSAVERTEIPAAPDVAARVEDYEGREALAEGEDFDTSPEAIESRIERRQLGSGLELILLPKETRGDVVQLALTLHFGAVDTLKGRAAAGEGVAALLRRGSERYDRQQIADELDRLRAQLRLGGDATSLEASVEVPRQHLAETVELLAEILRHPTFPSEELATFKQEVLAQLEESRNEPTQLGFLDFQRVLNPWPEDDPRYVPTVDEAIARVDGLERDDLVRFHEEFYGASKGELALVGDFDPKLVVPVIEKELGGWKSVEPYHRLESPFKATPPGSRTLETPDKESAVFVAGMALEVQDSDADYPALVLGNFMTGGGFLSSRLGERLRNQDGLSYGVNSVLNASPFEKNGRFLAYAIYAPQNAAKLESGFREEIQKILDDGFAAAEIEAAKEGWLQTRSVSRSQDRELARRLTTLGDAERTLLWDQELERKVQALTAEEIHQVFRRHLDLDKFYMVKAGDFAGHSE